jgi:hypothetical protein
MHPQSECHATAAVTEQQFRLQSMRQHASHSFTSCRGASPAPLLDSYMDTHASGACLLCAAAAGRAAHAHAGRHSHGPEQVSSSANWLLLRQLHSMCHDWFKSGRSSWNTASRGCGGSNIPPCDSLEATAGTRGCRWRDVSSLPKNVAG